MLTLLCPLWILQFLVSVQGDSYSEVPDFVLPSLYSLPFVKLNKTNSIFSTHPSSLLSLLKQHFFLNCRHHKWIYSSDYLSCQRNEWSKQKTSINMFLSETSLFIYIMSVLNKCFYFCLTLEYHVQLVIYQDLQVTELKSHRMV